MILIKHHYERKGTGFSEKEWREILSVAWERTGRFWHRSILPKHFTVAGGKEYGYQARTVRYMQRKASRMGHQNPLVWSGNMKAECLRIRDIRANSKGANVILHGPKYMFQYKPGQPKKHEELQAISQKDGELVSQFMDKELEKCFAMTHRVIDIFSGHRRSA